MNPLPEGFSGRVVRWQKVHGRNDLPWQNTRDPYRVWLSEIMLQQTQVATVKDYYARFLKQFPGVETLAEGDMDEVLALWSGLGYYSRARNLHRCAVEIVERHGGAFPDTAAVLQTLPGIGPSTAAAIASICFGERAAILDGNVRRVLTRVLAFDKDLSIAANARQLWVAAQALLPEKNLLVTMPRYTQGLMDLGATVCALRNPQCDACPVSELCEARKQGIQSRLPVRTRKPKRSSQSLWMLWLQREDGAVWLSQRPTPGVWAGLYCFPLFDDLSSLQEAIPLANRAALAEDEVLRHVLTHKDLHLHPVRIAALSNTTLKNLDGTWVRPDQLSSTGLPAPIRKLLMRIE